MNKSADSNKISEKRVNHLMIKTFKNKKILITGGTGSIGSEITRQLLKYYPQQIRIYSRDEYKHMQLENEIRQTNTPIDVKSFIGDVRDKERLEKAINQVDIIFHVAALKHIPYCEQNPFEAIKTNVYGTQNVVDLAIEKNVDKVIAISTDKAVDPSSIMGATKLLMEKIIISAKCYSGSARTKFSIVRFGNVLESRGSVIPTWKEQIKNGGPVIVTNKKMKRFFMSINEAVNLVFLATSIMHGQEVFVLKMSEKNIYQLAKETIKKYAAGNKIEIKIVGNRPGEKVKERLFTDDEKKLMLDMGKFWIILQNEILYKERRNKFF